MKTGLTSDAMTVGVEGDALASDDGVELGEAIEVAVDDRLVEVDPQRLDRVELGSVATVFQAGCLV